MKSRSFHGPCHEREMAQLVVMITLRPLHTNHATPDILCGPNSSRMRLGYRHYFLF